MLSPRTENLSFTLSCMAPFLRMLLKLLGVTRCGNELCFAEYPEPLPNLSLSPSEPCLSSW